jgi:glyoxylase-like metal-dependent hydrolase (beta-lactamase superfamily II)
MKLQQFILGELKVNTYLLSDEETRETVCLDPGGPPQEILAELASHNLKLKYILLTHGHYDHIAGVNELKATTDAVVAVHVSDADWLANPALNLSTLFGTEIVVKADQLLNDGDILCLGSNMLTIHHTGRHFHHHSLSVI